jgi:hypothetical protein
MRNWKTTVSGIIAALPQFAILLGVQGVPPEVWNGISAIGIFILGLIAKDLNVTGGNVNQ